MPPHFKLNPKFQRQWQEAIKELSSFAKRDTPENLHKLVTQSARRFVKNVVAITPPSRGKADAQSKLRGEEAILTDLLKIAVPFVADGLSRRRARELFATAEDLIALHERSRSGARGRVNPRNRKQLLHLPQAEFQAALKKLQKAVGFLAAALNAAATRLGVSLPSWIKRHGSRFGSITVRATPHGLRIRVVQDAPFADDVRGYHRQWDAALEKEIHSLLGMIRAIYARNAAKAKAKLH